MSIEDLTHNARYSRLRDSLANTQSRLTDIRTRLNDPQLSDASTHKLLGSIRKSAVDAIYQHRNLEEWIWRCDRMGSEYAQATMQEQGAAADAFRTEFYGEQDSYLKLNGGTREEVVAMILQHVGVCRDAVLGVEILQGEKERLLEAERDAAAGRIDG
jgi:hypothetical protein